MTDQIMTVRVAAGCPKPKCGNPDIRVPEEFDDSTIIKCGKCGYEAPHADFFAMDDDKPQN
jgi:Zn ribbon nucleic-acid-binding protein